MTTSSECPTPSCGIHPKIANSYTWYQYTLIPCLFQSVIFCHMVRAASGSLQVLDLVTTFYCFTPNTPGKSKHISAQRLQSSSIYYLPARCRDPGTTYYIHQRLYAHNIYGDMMYCCSNIRRPRDNIHYTHCRMASIIII